MELHAEGLRRVFAGTTVVDDVGFALPTGGSLALCGPSGCGKSTLLQIVAGLDHPDHGSVRWDGADIYAWGGGRRERERLRHVGLLRQDPDLEPQLNARENVLLAAAFRLVAGAEARADELLRRVDLAHCSGVPGAALSGGQAVRVALVRALLRRPRLLIADEPSASLDPDNARRVGDLLLRLIAEEGITLLLATHDHELAARCEQRLELTAAGSA